MRRRLGVLLFLASATAAFAEGGISDLRPTVRDVTPSGVTPAPRVEGPLERIPALPRVPEPARWWRFYLPVTTDSATFVTDGRIIRVAGVIPPPVDRICASPDGSEWPCGRMALTSLRMFLRGRAVECFYVLSQATPEMTTPCRVGPTDIAAWLLTQGWAAPADEVSEDYRRDAAAARCGKRGLWRGEVPPDTCAAVTN
jgi:endonuclease YncB( thermonuclease family)